MSLFPGRAAIIGAATLCILAIGMTGIAQADDYNVTRQDDPADDSLCDSGVDCSLRQAVNASNDNSGTDTINIPGGTYDVTVFGQLLIDRSDGTLAIKGAGAPITTIDAGKLDRVIKITEATVTIQGVTITGGGNIYGGAGIVNYSDAVTTLNQVAIVGNVAGTTCDEGKGPSICFVTGAGQGGGIRNSGTLTVEQSEISNNVALGDDICDEGLGGGIYNKGQMTLTNVTISDNFANDSGSECSDPGLGGGIFQVTYVDSQAAGQRGAEVLAPSTALNLTISNNTAGWGGGVASDYFFNDTAEPQQDLSSIEFTNTIVANNTATQELPSGAVKATSDADNCYPLEASSIVSKGHNLESDTSCGFLAGGDLQNKDPLLGALLNNGGPTNTRALLDGSPALDTAENPPVCPGTDQRGVTRPQGPVCDIGAYEKEVVVPTPAPAPGAVAAVKVQAKPPASAKISGTRGCVRSSATARVSGKNIASVTFSRNGKKIKTVKGSKASVKVALGSAKVVKVSAKITFTTATAAKAQTKRITFVRCAKAKPKFTG